MSRVLILYAHPAPHRSLANAAMIAAVRDLPGVTVHDLYETYPDLLIDIEAEQDLLVRHDVIVLQHPLFWYSAPAIVKEWLDVVLEHGFAYGESGAALAGKSWQQAVTAGGGAAAYGPAGRNRFTIPELLRPFEATAALCGCRWLDPFVMHAAHLLDAAGVAAESARYRSLVATLAKAPVAVPP